MSLERTDAGQPGRRQRPSGPESVVQRRRVGSVTMLVSTLQEWRARKPHLRYFGSRPQWGRPQSLVSLIGVRPAGRVVAADDPAAVVIAPRLRGASRRAGTSGTEPSGSPVSRSGGDGLGGGCP